MWACCDCGSVFDVPDVQETRTGVIYLCPYCGAIAFRK